MSTVIQLHDNVIMFGVWFVLVYLILKSKNILVVAAATMLNLYFTFYLYNEELVLINFPVFFIALIINLIGVYRVMDAVAESRKKKKSSGGLR